MDDGKWVGTSGGWGRPSPRATRETRIIRSLRHVGLTSRLAGAILRVLRIHSLHLLKKENSRSIFSWTCATIRIDRSQREADSTFQQFALYSTSYHTPPLLQQHCTISTYRPGPVRHEVPHSNHFPTSATWRERIQFSGAERARSGWNGVELIFLIDKTLHCIAEAPTFTSSPPSWRRHQMGCRPQGLPATAPTR